MLEIDRIEKSYGTFALGPVDLAVGEEVLAVLGPSGCGKTTLLSAVAGVIEPDAGQVILNGTDLTGRPPEDRDAVLVFQDGALFPHMTARENVSYAASSEERVESLAEALEIGNILDQRADTLSGGERQRVALARSLATDPAALLLDEPLANLDAPIKRRLRDELRPLLSALDIPVIYVTHDQREATALGDQIAVVNDGRIEQLDTPAEVFAHPETPFVASFTGSVNLFRARVAKMDRNIVLDWNGRRLHASGEEYEPGAVVDFCIRPEYVTLVDGPAENHTNIVSGTVDRRVFEGDDYLIDVELDGPDDVIRVRLPPPVYDRRELADGNRVRVSLDAGAIHVIGADHSPKSHSETTGDRPMTQ